MRVNPYTKNIIIARDTGNLVDATAVSDAGRLGQAASSLTDIGLQYMEREKLADEKTWLNETQISKKKQQIDLQHKYQQNYTDNPKGYSQDYNLALEELDKTLAETAPSERAKNAYLLAAKQDNVNTYENSKSWERKARVASFDRRLKASTQDLQNIAFGIGKSGEDFDESILGDIDATVLAGSDVYSPEQLAILREGLREQVQVSHIEGMIATNPQEAQRLLGTGKYIGVGDKPDFDAEIKDLFDIEGGFVANDAGAGPTIYGINSAANPKDYEEIIKIRKEQGEAAAKEKAREVYKREYWDKVGADKLSPEMAALAFDTAVNMGVGAAKDLLARSDGDVDEFIDLRKQKYVNIAKNNPDKAPYLKGWLGRVEKLAAKVNGGAIGSESRDKLQNMADKEVAAQEKRFAAEQKKIMDYKDSQHGLAIDTAMNDAESSKTYKINQVITKIEQDEDYNLTAEGVIAKNKLIKKAFAALADENKKQENIILGSSFVNGTAQINPQDKAQVSAFNDYYNSIAPMFAELTPTEQNIAKAEIITKSNSIPKAVKGEIQMAARSLDGETISQAADFIDRVSINNPHLVQHLASEKDMARIDMVNSRINAGYTEAEAIKAVDNQLDPRNSINLAQATQELKNENIDYQDYVEDVFDSSSLETERPYNINQITGATAAYRVAFEDHYKITRDLEASKKHANRMIQGMYGVSSVNGDTAVMMFPPERYYGIDGVDNDWMRDQMIEDAQKLLNKNFKEYAGQYSKADLKRRLVLTPNKNTSRTAGTGRPLYSLNYAQDDGSYLILGNNYYFDTGKKRKQLIEDAKANATEQDLQMLRDMKQSELQGR